MRRFWLITVAQGAASFVNQMLLAHQVAYLVDHGVTTLVAASVVGVVGLGARGSYTAAFVLALAAGVIATTALWLAAPRRGADPRT